MSPISCRNTRKLSAFSTGRLSAQELEALAQHLDACPDCQGAIQTLPEPPDPLFAELRQPVPTDSYFEEPACRRAVTMAAAIPVELT